MVAAAGLLLSGALLHEIGLAPWEGSLSRIPLPDISAAPPPRPVTKPIPLAAPPASEGDSLAKELPAPAMRNWLTDEPHIVRLPAPRKIEPGQAAELASLEDEASRHAAGLGKDSPEVEEALRGLKPNQGESPDEFARRVDDQRRRLLANAYLVEAAMREDLESGVYPPGFPAEQRAREAAQAAVNNYELNTDAKMTFLRRALEQYGSMSTPVQVQYEEARPPSTNNDTSE
jgi:hypothetical protein